MLIIQRSQIHLLEEKKLNFQNIYREFQKKEYKNPFCITVHEEDEIFVYLAHIKPACNRRRRVFFGLESITNIMGTPKVHKIFPRNTSFSETVG
jgi:hypothetical protein